MYRPEKNKPFVKRSFRQTADRMMAVSLGLSELGMQPGDKIGLIADVGPDWLPVCWGICGIGGVDVPRGTDATAGDLTYIFEHAECQIIFLETRAVYDKIGAQIGSFSGLKTIIFYQTTDLPDIAGIRVMTLDELIASGQAVSDGAAKYRQLGQAVAEDDLATIIYTSGTTGAPKGVMHTQKSLTWEIDQAIKGIHVPKNGVTMGFLPPWHIAERLIEGVAWHTITATAFTSVPTLAKDLQEAQPTFLLSVPRVWESFYNKVFDGVKKASPVAQKLFGFARWSAYTWSIQKDVLLGRKYYLARQNLIVSGVRKLGALVALNFLFVPNLIAQLILGKVRKALGGRVEFAISGAGALPEHIDRFFYSVGIPILETYGMTETVGVTCRRDKPRTVVGTVGKPFQGTQIKLIDEQGNEVTEPNQKGVAWHFGPHIMKGYYKNPEKTAEVLKDGWLNSGDILVYTNHGELKFAGRAKDTIVLFGGENVEPQPIEDTLSQSAYIQQVVVVGQDQKTLAALIVPNKEAVLAELGAASPGDDIQAWRDNKAVQQLFKQEIKSRVSAEAGFKSFEKVTAFDLLDKEFQIGDELTQTLKVKRNVVLEKYADRIKALYQ
ncbi:MAG: AMP-binding protein [Leptospiraceae bacterium]|nr:AMP-binding protein [Leptospiraceae bacterium]